MNKDALIRSGTRPILFLLAMMLLLSGALTAPSGCSCHSRNESGQEPGPAASPAPKPPAPETIAPETPAPTAEEVFAKFQVATLTGEPLAGMTPIATLQPNAFDAPIAVGPATDASGNSYLRFPGDRKVALRAWDPSLLYFPNNFYDALPGTGSVTDTLVITMVRAAALEAVLVAPNGQYIEHENAGIMLFHPVHGPWWPADAEVGEKGAVVFRPVPPGNYVMRIKTASGGMRELPETFIAPDDVAHLGMVYLQQ